MKNDQIEISSQFIRNMIEEVRDMNKRMDISLAKTHELRRMVDNLLPDTGGMKIIHRKS